MKSEDRKILKLFLNLRYPRGTHELGLDITFDYYAGLIDQALRNIHDLGHRLYPLSSDIEVLISTYINSNLSNENGKEMKQYYYLLCVSIDILRRYYNEEGKYIQ